MNALTSAILWMAVQVLLFSLVGGAAFVLLRRRGPSAAVACAATVLALTLPLVFCLASPWPQWIGTSDSRISATQANAGLAPSTIQNQSSDAIISAADSANATHGSVLSTVSNWWLKAVEWLQPTSNFANGEKSAAPIWQIAMLWVLATGVSLSLARLAAGMWAVHRLRHRSQPIDNPALESTLRELSQRLNAPTVELRHTEWLRSAATIGWRRPMLLLPADWSGWTETERRVVLAHELAHVARRDYFTALLAQLVSAIHFYQPLVLWLSRQLRVQQELAADGQAAAVTENRQAYLATLAQMALRADEQPVPWAARAFLPGTSMLIKRVAWLKRKGQRTETSLGRTGRWILAACMAAIALGVAGLRGPRDSFTQVAMAAPADDAKQSETKKDAERAWDVSQPQPAVLRSFRFVPSEAKLVVGINPHELAKTASAAKPIVDMLDKEFEGKNGFKLTDIADVELIWMHSTQEPDRIVIQTEKPIDWKETLRRKNPGDMEIQHQGDHEYYVLKDSADFGPCVYPVDNRTIVAGSEKQIQTFIRGGEKLMDASAFPEFPASTLAIRAEISIMKPITELDALSAAMFLPLMEHVKVGRGFVGAEPPGTNGVGFHALLECDSADGAQQVAKTLEVARTIVLNMIQMKIQAWRQTEGQTADKEQAAQINGLFDLLTKALSDCKINAAGSVAQVSANVELGPALVAGFLMPAMAAAKEAAMRQQTMTNMKQLGLAMFEYADKHNHFPPAAIVGPDGKTKHSWRVEVLPLLNTVEANTVYKEYHFDEPWDSEHNKALLAKMPAVLRDPHEPEGSTDACYFMPTGKGMIGGSETGTRLEDITDGTAVTIALVEAKRDIPWTKPEDIEIDADSTKPLPKFGGHLADATGSNNIYAAVFADGHVQIMSNEADPKWVRAAFTISGGEPLDGGRLSAPQEQKRLTPDLKPVNPQSTPVPPGSGSKIDRPKLEFRLAEAEPGEGLTEAALPGGTEKVYLHLQAELSKDDIASIQLMPNENGTEGISITLTEAGGEKMEALTAANLLKRLAVLVDGKVLVAPRIQSKISDKMQLTGNFSKEELEQLSKTLGGDPRH
ncbi:MAG TPA: M56 family metallopeptidase [Pirellulales bacterium]|jgi:beta-lactamase regulating signal transducer with metallopeptidase domain|nr:M56 family metallopeptidase [Pirellulales bacterium]